MASRRKNIRNKVKITIVDFVWVAVLCFLPGLLFASEARPEIHLLPQPRQIEWHDDAFPILGIRMDETEVIPNLKKWVQDVGLEITSDADVVLSVIWVDDIEKNNLFTR